MGPVLHGLTKLQSVENHLRAAKAKLTRCRRNVIFQENLLRTLGSGLEAKKEEGKLTQVQIDRLELDLKSRDEYIAKYRAALNLAKSNKEYSAILTELNTAKADNSKLESQIFELMKIIETDDTECKEIQTQIDQQKNKVDELRKETGIKAVKYEEEIEEIQVKWEQIASTIPPAILEIFKRVAETYDGEALALAEQQDERVQAYSCGGCFMGLTAETLNQLMTKDEIIRCPTCTRILILKEDGPD